MKLGLGTVTFGLNYGISNTCGKTPPFAVRRILSAAWEAGIRLIDTAPHYGNSEEIIGKSLPRTYSFQIVTKVPAFGKERFDAGDGKTLRETFRTSLRRLRQERLKGLLLHNADELFRPGGEILYQAASSVVQEGLVAKLGVSVYTREQIERVLANYPIGLIQVPVNIFDHRLIDSGLLKELHAQGVEIHARSPFLQGIIFMEPGSLGSFFASMQPQLARFHQELKYRGIRPVTAALAFLMAIEEIDTIIIGVNTLEQLVSNMRDYEEAKSVHLDFCQFKVDNETVINPILWPQGQRRRRRHD